MKRLGLRIKRNREKLNLALADLSKRVGISASALSQIENGKAFPSVLTLKSIADSLYTTVGELIGENETLTDNPLVKAKDRNFVKNSSTGASLFLLSHHENSKQMETYLIALPENSDVSDMMLNHTGQEFIFVLNGRLLMVLDNKEYILEKGDSFYYNSNINHYLKNISNAESSIIWIISPPNI